MSAITGLTLEDIVDIAAYPLSDTSFRSQCREALDRDGALNLSSFLRESAVDAVRRDGEANQHEAYFCRQEHNVYLTETDASFEPDHARNRLVVSSKGCITDDQIAHDSPLRVLYDSFQFRDFLCAVLGERALHDYADPLSSINLHYAGEGQELGWHFDNSSFAITLLIQAPEAGGEFEYVDSVRNTARGDMNFECVARVLDGGVDGKHLEMTAGTLLLFRGRDAMHRVKPTAGARTRMLAVLAYNAEAGVSLSESARMTFYGRLG